MECDQCGARRPRTGPCPECGAPPPGTHSSMRQWRDQARTGKRPAVGGRGSGANWRAGRQPDEWDNGDEYNQYGQYDEGPPSGRMSARQARPAQNYQDYEEVDLERALVPNYGDLMPMAQSMGSVAIPGMPATDDEERALGI